MSTIIVFITVAAIIAADFAVCYTVGKAVINAVKYIISSIKKAFRH
jgi:hydroxymethylpyrimidine/phosphomethylpyrimidine kinase